jgi:hypothetical protein
LLFLTAEAVLVIAFRVVLTFYKQFPKDLSSLNKTITVHLQYFALFLDQQTKEEWPKEN